MINHASEQKLAPLRVKNDFMHVIQLKLQEKWIKSWFEVIVTSYGRDKNLNEKKTREGQ